MSSLEELAQQRDALLAQRNALIKSNRRNAIHTRKHTLTTYNNAKALLSRHSRLPVLDMDRRLRYVSLTCPWMTVESVKKTKPSSTSRSKSTNIHIVLNFKTCAKFNVNISVSQSYIKKLKISPMTTIDIGESAVVHSLIDSTNVSGDISSFVYKLNSILRLRHKRRHIFSAIVQAIDFSKTNIATINNHRISPSTNADVLARVLFDNSPTMLIVSTTSGKSISILWKIATTSSATHAVSDFAAFKTSTTSTCISITKLYKSLILANDVKTATLQLLHTL